MVLRIEDLDTPRIKPGAIDQTIDELGWLGLDWDEGPIVQSADLEPYRAAMATLARARLLYPCALTRSQIERAASAPHEGEHETRFPLSLRPPERPTQFDRADINWRLVVDPGEVVVDDRFAGRVAVDPGRSVGDFVVWTQRGTPAYQLAVVVDDARQGINRIVRGDDLLGSTARQALIRCGLGIGCEPETWHLPLVRGPDGRRLAKRHGDTRIDHYRQLGVSAWRVIALVARWCGIDDAGRAMSAKEFAQRLDVSRMSRAEITFSQEDDRWLTAS